ncbi:DUF4277 domain-containing protein [Streptomyces sp. NBC_00841]|uniref:DUF4277 domain-containing protein n=1 Tax=Streptomyces sp. NBC_00841 TaxID=2975847 RepID=UPI003FA3ABEB
MRQSREPVLRGSLIWMDRVSRWCVGRGRGVWLGVSMTSRSSRLRSRRECVVTPVVEKRLGAVPVAAEFLRCLDVTGIVDELCPGGASAHVTHRQVIEALVANRLTSPAPLVRVGDWGRTWAVEEVLASTRTSSTTNASGDGRDRSQLEQIDGLRVSLVHPNPNAGAGRPLGGRPAPTSSGPRMGRRR